MAETEAERVAATRAAWDELEAGYRRIGDWNATAERWGAIDPTRRGERGKPMTTLELIREDERRRQESRHG